MFLGYALLVSEVRIAVPLPPCIIVAASVDGTSVSYTHLKVAQDFAMSEISLIVVL